MSGPAGALIANNLVAGDIGDAAAFVVDKEPAVGAIMWFGGIMAPVGGVVDIDPGIFTMANLRKGGS